MTQDNSTSKMLAEMGLNTGSQTANEKAPITHSNEPLTYLNKKENTANATPQPNLTPELGNLITNILTMSSSKKPSPRDK